MVERTPYVAGFLLCVHHVLLVSKRQPPWQRGLLNAVGGKVEPGEKVDYAMAREFREETLIEFKLEWHNFAIEAGPNYVTYFYRAEVKTRHDVPNVNDVGEPLEWYDLGKLVDTKMVGNLRWLVPLALDWRGVRATVQTQDDIRERPSW